MRAMLPLLIVLTGCGAPSVVQTKDGSAYTVDCGGPFGTKLDCNERASRLCPAGFDPIASPVGSLVFTCSKRAVPASAPPPA